MSYEEEFDKIIKQKAEQAEYPFDKSDWEKAAAMLDAQRGAPALPFWKKFAVPAIIGVAVLSIGIALMPSENSNRTNSVATTNTETIPDLSTLNRATSTATLAENNAEAVQIKPTKNPTSLNNPASPKAAKPFDGGTSLPNTKNDNNSPSEIKTKATNLPPDQPSSIKPSDAGLAGATVKAEAKNQDEALNTKSEEAANEKTTEVEVSKGSNENADNSGLELGLGSTDNHANTNINAAVSTDIEQMSTPNNNNVTANDIVSSEWLPSHAVALTLPSDCTFVNITLQALPQLNISDYVRKQPTYFLALNGGMHYALGWETAVGVDGKGYNYFAGIEFGKYIKPELSLSAGLQYFRFTNIENPYYSSIGKGYGFGYTKKYSAVTVDQLNYISVPVNLVFTSKDGIVFGTGFTTNYLAAAHSRVDSYEISDGVKSQTTSSGNTKIYEGTSSLNFMAHVRLGYAMSRKFGVYGELQYGLNDMFDSKTKKQNDERSTGLRIGLNYYLIGK